MWIRGEVNAYPQNVDKKHVFFNFFFYVKVFTQPISAFVKLCDFLKHLKIAATHDFHLM